MSWTRRSVRAPVWTAWFAPVPGGSVERDGEGAGATARGTARGTIQPAPRAACRARGHPRATRHLGAAVTRALVAALKGRGQRRDRFPPDRDRAAVPCRAERCACTVDPGARSGGMDCLEGPVAHVVGSRAFLIRVPYSPVGPNRSTRIAAGSR